LPNDIGQAFGSHAFGEGCGILKHGLKLQIPF
jgi:hypothetical protein